MSYVLREIKDERFRQDKKWGGPEHDDEHDGHDWSCYISERMGALTGDPLKDRKLLIQIAALAVAEIESSDRKRGVLPYASIILKAIYGASKGQTVELSDDSEGRTLGMTVGGVRYFTYMTYATTREWFRADAERQELRDLIPNVGPELDLWMSDSIKTPVSRAKLVQYCIKIGQDLGKALDEDRQLPS